MVPARAAGVSLEVTGDYMPYSYQNERPWLFTEEGQVCLLKARDNAFALIKAAGAFESMKCLRDVNYGDTFKAMALLDRLVELGDIKEVTGPNVWGQHRIFVAGRGVA